MPGNRPNVHPPNPPWTALSLDDPETGCLSYYISDALGSLPVRGVTLPNNNKSDPNLETRTYGLFSTCERQMRSSVVRRGLRYLIFVTRWKGSRVVTGIYQLAWFTEGSFGGGTSADYALAAEVVRFVEPIPVSSIGGSAGRAASAPFRTFLLLDAADTSALVRLICAKRDLSSQYLQEIDRLERFNMHHSGYRCWGRREAFSWSAAAAYLVPSEGKSWSVSAEISNVSSSGMWSCDACNAVIQNEVLLKMCPSCGATGALRPVNRKAE
jgi:hypothetical protein